LEHAARAARKVKYSKQNDLTGDDLVDYTPTDPCFARASPEEFNAFRDWVIKKYKTPGKAFREWDFNGSGLIGDSEWFKALSELGYTEDENLAKRLFRSFDVFDKNFVCNKTFLLLYRGATGSDGRPPPGSPTATSPKSAKLSPMSKAQAQNPPPEPDFGGIDMMVPQDERIKAKLFRDFPYPEKPPTPNPRIVRLLGENVERFFEMQKPPEQLSFRHQFDRRVGVAAAFQPKEPQSVGVSAWKKGRKSVRNFLADERGEERPPDGPSMLEKITAAAKALKVADEEAHRASVIRASKEAETTGPQRDPVVPLPTIQVRMAYLIPPKNHYGWDHEKQRSLVTAEEETKWRELPWKVVDQTHVQCTICNGTYHIDKDWGNAQCWACSIVDRMELGGNMFVKLLSPPVLTQYVAATNADTPAPKASRRRSSVESSDGQVMDTLGSLAGDVMVSLNEYDQS
jgi:hypothetical protein